MIYPKNFEEKTGFNIIREMLKTSCLSDLGRANVEAMNLINQGNILEEELNRVKEMKDICLYEDEFPTQYYFDIVPALKKVKVEGGYIELPELFNFKRSFEVIKAILNFFKKQEEDKFPYLKKVGSDIKVYPFVFDSLNKMLTKNGEVKDNASPELHSIRRMMNEKKKSANGKIHSLLKKAKGEGIVEQDVNLAIRDGRMVIPVSYTNKRSIRGIVHDESATGKTVYIEPAEIVELNNELKELEYAERREIVRILVAFSDDIRPYLDDIIEAYKYMGTIDFIRSKARVALSFKAELPRLLSIPKINWIEAIHPLLYLTHEKEDKKVVPLDIQLDEENRVLLISGPNAGGKSVCLKTVGLLQYMLQCGMLVPASETSEFGLFDNIFIDIGDEQSIENDLSTYSSHLMNMKYFIKNADHSTLLLIDEFGTGTEPMLGGAIAESILGKLVRKKVFGVLTTHYSNLKHFASSIEGIQNGAMLFDTHKMEPMFKLEIGKPGSSFAFEIARKIGLPEDVLKDATEKIGEDHIQFDRHLKDIIRDKRYWGNKRQRIRKSEKKLEDVLNKYDEELNEAKKLKKQIILDAKKEAEEILSGINKQIEKTIRDIKESEAEKEKTRQARKELEDKKKQIFQDEKENGEIDKKIKQLNQQKKRFKSDIQLDEEEKIKHDEISEGDIVQLVGQETYGEVLEVNGKSILVAFGNMITTLDEKKLIRAKDKKVKGKKSTSASLDSGWNITERKLKFKPHIDIRGQRAEEAIQKVMEFIDEAIVVNEKQLSILHGKGNGVLRQIIREYLNTVDVVKTCKDEHIERGGAGITLVGLDI